MGCRFCASTRNGLVRNLTPGEILSQVMDAEADTGEKIGHIVVMGTGAVSYTHLDNDLLLSMPVPVKSILISRLLSVLLLNYIYELLVPVSYTHLDVYKRQTVGYVAIDKSAKKIKVRHSWDLSKI